MSPLLYTFLCLVILTFARADLGRLARDILPFEDYKKLGDEFIYNHLNRVCDGVTRSLFNYIRSGSCEIVNVTPEMLKWTKNHDLTDIKTVDSSSTSVQFDMKTSGPHTWSISCEKESIQPLLNFLPYFKRAGSREPKNLVAAFRRNTFRVYRNTLSVHTRDGIFELARYEGDKMVPVGSEAGVKRRPSIGARFRSKFSLQG